MKNDMASGMMAAGQAQVDTMMKRMNKRIALMDKQFANNKENLMEAAEVFSSC